MLTVRIAGLDDDMYGMSLSGRDSGEYWCENIKLNRRAEKRQTDDFFSSYGNGAR